MRGGRLREELAGLATGAHKSALSADRGEGRAIAGFRADGEGRGGLDALEVARAFPVCDGIAEGLGFGGVEMCVVFDDVGAKCGASEIAG